MIDLLKTRTPPTLLGLALNGRRLEGAWVRRTNGTLRVEKTFSGLLSLNPLKDEPELLGLEIRKKLDEAGIRERRCVVCIPLDWAMCLQTPVPEMPEEDVSSFLEIEAERGFPYPPDALFICRSTARVEGGSLVLQVAVPREHVTRLEMALRAARLRPASFSTGLTSLQDPRLESSQGITLAIEGARIGLMACAGGGILALRSFEAGFEEDAASSERLFADLIAREVRVTLGHLAPGVRDGLKRLWILGPESSARRLAEEIAPRARALGLTVETAGSGSASDAAAERKTSPALSLAAQVLEGRSPVLEFLPPRVSAWREYADRYSSRKLAYAGVVAAVVALVAALAFAVQQWQLSRLQSRWNAMRPRVGELEVIQRNIRQFRPWFDNSFRSLAILRKLTEAFPEDGAVSVKTFEIRGSADVTCSGVARDQQAFLKTLDALRATEGVRNVTVDQVRGENPLQFSFNFQWGEGGAGGN